MLELCTIKISTQGSLSIVFKSNGPFQEWGFQLQSCWKILGHYLYGENRLNIDEKNWTLGVYGTWCKKLKDQNANWIFLPKWRVPELELYEGNRAFSYRETPKWWSRQIIFVNNIPEVWTIKILMQRSRSKKFETNPPPQNERLQFSYCCKNLSFRSKINLRMKTDKCLKKFWLQDVSGFWCKEPNDWNLKPIFSRKCRISGNDSHGENQNCSHRETPFP